MFFSKTKLKVLKMVWDGRNKIKFEHLSKSRFRGQLVPSDPIMIMILNPVTQLPTHFFSICCVLHIPPQLVYLLSLFCFYIISRLTLARLSSSSSSKSSKLSLFSFIRVGLFPPKFGTSVSGALIGQSLSVGSTGNERETGVIVSVTRRFNTLWATFQSLWQQLFCPNCLYFYTIFCKGLKNFHFSCEIIFGQLL